MLVQAGALAMVAVGQDFGIWLAAAVLLGVGTAMVYPTLLAAIVDVAHPNWRVRSVGTYRFWRDSGFAAGALISGIYRRCLRPNRSRGGSLSPLPEYLASSLPYECRIDHKPMHLRQTHPPSGSNKPRSDCPVVGQRLSNSGGIVPVLGVAHVFPLIHHQEDSRQFAVLDGRRS